MRQDNRHNAITLEVIEVVQEEGIVSLTLGGNTILKSRVNLDLYTRPSLARRRPAL